MSSDFWEQVRAAVVAVEAGSSSGTGWVALPNGLVVTNVHVVGYSSRVGVRTSAGVEAAAKVVHADTRRDIAFLMPTTPLETPPLALANSEQAVPGMQVIAVGHPLGLPFTVTQGILSAAGRQRNGIPYLQTDAALNPGNSGGPLLDREAKVLGINTWIRADGQNLGFALPVHLIRDDLARFAGPREQVLALAAVYKCTDCDSQYQPNDDRCLNCGAPVPFVGNAGIAVYAQSYAQAERTVAGMLGRIGFIPNQVWVDKGLWRLPQPSGGAVWVGLDPEGHYVQFTSRLVRLPPAGHEGFFRFLLTFNDRTSGPCRLALDGGVITLSFSEPTGFLNQNEVTSALRLLLAMSEQLRRRLNEGFAAPLAGSGLRDDNA